ncbi:hypothetical protein GCM10023333_06180 [Ferrimonas pelagia]|uniref:Uncharacterized protein n=1 Tax=Ferrimonas pelagia TaxID=1177826 RepID=A0ABP9EG09_9GAMM
MDTTSNISEFETSQDLKLDIGDDISKDRQFSNISEHLYDREKSYFSSDGMLQRGEQDYYSVVEQFQLK